MQKFPAFFRKNIFINDKGKSKEIFTKCIAAQKMFNN